MVRTKETPRRRHEVRHCVLTHPLQPVLHSCACAAVARGTLRLLSRDVDLIISVLPSSIPPWPCVWPFSWWPHTPLLPLTPLLFGFLHPAVGACACGGATCPACRVDRRQMGTRCACRMWGYLSATPPARRPRAPATSSSSTTTPAASAAPRSHRALLPSQWFVGSPTQRRAAGRASGRPHRRVRKKRR